MVGEGTEKKTKREFSILNSRENFQFVEKKD